jgi:hypothetical protein
MSRGGGAESQLSRELNGPIAVQSSLFEPDRRVDLCDPVRLIDFIRVNSCSFVDQEFFVRVHGKVFMCDRAEDV